MNHIHFNVQDPRWAIVLAGAIASSRENNYKQMNKHFTVSFDTSNTLIAHMAKYFEEKPLGAKDYAMPTEKHYPEIDKYQAAMHAKNLFENHGIKQDPIVMPLYLQHLASNSLLLTHGIASKAGYFMPKPNRKRLLDAPDCNVLVQHESMKDVGTQFARGLGIENPTILVASDYDDLTAAMIYFKSNLLVTKPDHFLQYVARAQYLGFDSLSDNKPVLSVLDQTTQQDNRYLVSWNAQIPVFLHEPSDSIFSKGNAWRIRSTFQFDHRRFYKYKYDKETKGQKV